MNVALVITPNYASYSVPLGFATLKTFIEQNSQKVHPFDIEQHLRIADRKLLFDLHQIFYRRIHYEDVVWFRRPELLIWSLLTEKSHTEAELCFSISSDEIEILNRAERYFIIWVRRILAVRPVGVMFATYITNMWPSLFLAKKIKEIAPDLPIVFGGPGCSLPPCQEFCLRTGWVDFCISGEGEVAATTLLQSYFQKDSTLTMNASFLENDQISRSQASPLLDPDNWVIPDFSNLPFIGSSRNLYRTNTGIFVIPITVTRGCAMKCHFCSETVYWDKFRIRTPKQVVDEIQDQRAHWNSKYFTFCDSTINFSNNWLEEFCDRMLAEDLNIIFTFAFARPARLSRKLLGKMHRVGFRCLYFGVESASQKLLVNLAKGTKPQEIEKILCDSLLEGIAVGANITSGFPIEDDQDFMASLFFLERMKKFREEHRKLSPMLAINANSRFRLEAYSNYYIQKDRFGIDIQQKCLKLPNAIGHCRSWLQPLFQTWSSDNTLTEIDWKQKIYEFYSDGHSVPLAPVIEHEDPETLAMLMYEDRFDTYQGVWEDGAGRVYSTNGQKFRMGDLEKKVFREVQKRSSIQEIIDFLSESYEGKLNDLVRSAVAFFLSHHLIEYACPGELKEKDMVDNIRDSLH